MKSLENITPPHSPNQLLAICTNTRLHEYSITLGRKFFLELLGYFGLPLLMCTFPSPYSSCSVLLQSPSFPDLQRNSLVSEDSNGGSDALKILREQLRSSVSSTFAPGGGNVGSVAKSVNEEKCSTPLVSHTQSQQQFRSIGHSLSSIPSPIPRQAASTPCSPRNGMPFIL